VQSVAFGLGTFGAGRFKLRRDCEEATQRAVSSLKVSLLAKRLAVAADGLP
jgi:hypothetical protein